MMKQPESEVPPCPVGPEIRADLLERDLLRLKPGERLWKLYCFHSSQGQTTDLRHRIYTKLKADGRLALVTFAAHTPASGVIARSNTAWVRDLPVEALEQIIAAIRLQTHASTSDMEEVDLSEIATLEEQLDWLDS